MFRKLFIFSADFFARISTVRPCAPQKAAGPLFASLRQAKAKQYGALSGAASEAGVYINVAQ